MDEQNVNVSTEDTAKQEPPKQDDATSTQELMVKIAMLEKKADKAASDAAEWKKKYNSTLDKAQQMELAKSEEDAKFKEKYAEMERRLEISDNHKSFANANIPSEYLEELSVAFYESDKATFFDALGKAIVSIQKNDKANALKNMPTAPISNSGVSITKEQFENMSLSERSDLYKKNPEVYKHFTNK